ncbi:hypothetical protein KGQ72_02305 [Patescibacteria group bacterium]|nr:hypothetical protein [Patescibacteria group bacterium]
MKSLTCIALVSAALLVPVLALADSTTVIVGSNTGGFLGVSWGTGLCTSNICGVANTVLYLINNVLVPVLFALAFIVFLWGIAKAYIFSGGDPEEVSRGHRLLLWGIIAFVVMISIWGLVNVVANTFGLAGSYAPPTPKSYPLY